jgi:hypothetical protein
MGSQNYMYCIVDIIAVGKIGIPKLHSSLGLDSTLFSPCLTDPPFLFGGNL